MAGVQLSVKGGDNLAKYLKGLGDKLGKGGVVRVGFLEDATYPTGKKSGGLHVAQTAFWNEFGTSRSRPRPFFRNMIHDDSPTWGRRLGAAAKLTKFDGAKALELLGQHIKDKLVEAIVRWPADNAPSTVARKGFNKGLVDQGVMQRAPDFEVVKR